MFSRGGFDARPGRRRTRGSKASAAAIAGLSRADPAKALVMTCICELVADGYAAWDVLDNGDVQVRLDTGETFLLAEAVIVRLA
jgi:hypothetical protein